jgi:hypothetical protein
LRRIIRIRRRHRIATSAQVDIPEVSHRALLVMVHELDAETLQITALNFSGESLTGTVRSDHLPPGARITNMFTDREVGTVDDLRSFNLELGEYEGTSLLVRASQDQEVPITQD